MRSNGLVYLMYHELEVDGRPLCHAEQGYVRYVVLESAFRDQMNWLNSMGIRGLSVTQAFDKRPANAIVITFDDGCETDLTIAAPILRSLNFGATFYITVNYLRRPGYMIPSQVRVLSDAGFDIGSHSLSHPYLDSLNDSDLHREIVESKNQLEQIIGRSVNHFSCPGGRWSPKVAAIARHAGYRTVTTSRIGVNHATNDSFQLARIAVMRTLTMPEFENLCGGRGLWKRQLRASLQQASHRLLGNTLYDRLRGIILEGKS